jgi:glutamine amidotransferase
MGAALAATIEAVTAAGGAGRFNFLLTDGQSIAATACGDTLWYRQSDGSVTVASEPDDDEAGWTEVPDRHLLTAVPGAVAVRSLDCIREPPASWAGPVLRPQDVRNEGTVTA